MCNSVFIFFISEHNFIDICSQNTITGHSIQLRHSAISPHTNFDQCSCVVTPEVCNTTAKLRFQSVDVRLHSINNNLTECSQESRLEIVGQKELKTYSCESGKFLHGFETFHESRENNLVVYLHKQQKRFPQEVWLQVSGKNSHIVSITNLRKI